MPSLDPVSPENPVVLSMSRGGRCPTWNLLAHPTARPSRIASNEWRAAPCSRPNASSVESTRHLSRPVATLPPDVPVLGDDAPDESWTYDEYNLNCFSFCLPTARHPRVRGSDWMESSRGIRVRLARFESYARQLGELCTGIGGDLARRSDTP